MQKLSKALVVSAALTWIPSLTAADKDPGLQFAIQPGTGNFVQFQSGPIKAGQETHVYYDSLRTSKEGPYGNQGCHFSFGDLTKVTGYVMSDNSGNITDFLLQSLDPPTVDYVKIGSFKTPECHNGSTELQIWFTGTDGKEICYDSDFGKNYRFPVICK